MCLSGGRQQGGEVNDMVANIHLLATNKYMTRQHGELRVKPHGLSSTGRVIHCAVDGECLLKLGHAILDHRRASAH